MLVATKAMEIEADIDFLIRSGENHNSHATHIALVMFELELLNQPPNIQSALLSKEAGDRGWVRGLMLAEAAASASLRSASCRFLSSSSLRLMSSGVMIPP